MILTHQLTMRRLMKEGRVLEAECVKRSMHGMVRAFGNRRLHEAIGIPFEGRG